MKRVVLTTVLTAFALGAQACMTIVVGRKASVTGRVVVGHNEDDGTPAWIKHGIVPARDWPEGSLLPATVGCNARIPQAAHTYACYWSEVKFPSGDANADSFYNENGVLVVSNSGCLSKERMDDPTLLTEGGVKFNLRRSVGERARTAREGMEIICNLVERYGYAPSARIYTVADKDEAWMVQVVHGKNYIAVRCPDDKVSVMPNVYTVHRLSEFPQGDVIVSSNLLVNARAKGFWNGEGDFDFALVYQDYPREKPANIYDSYPNSIGRSHQAVRFLSGRDFPARDPLPFAVVPNRRISSADLQVLLASHNAPLKDGVHVFETWSICAVSTVESTICEFAENPKGTTLSVALGHPCEKPYLSFRPFVEGIPASMDESASAVSRLASHCRPL